MFLVFIKRKCSGYFMLKFLIWLYINIVVNSELIMILNNKENVLKTNNRIVWGNAVVKSYIGYSNYVKPQWKFQLKTLFCVSCSQKHICKIFCSFSHAGIAIMYFLVNRFWQWVEMNLGMHPLSRRNEGEG